MPFIRPYDNIWPLVDVKVAAAVKKKEQRKCGLVAYLVQIGFVNS